MWEQNWTLETLKKPGEEWEGCYNSLGGNLHLGGRSRVGKEEIVRKAWGGVIRGERGKWRVWTEMPGATPCFSHLLWAFRLVFHLCEPLLPHNVKAAGIRTPQQEHLAQGAAHKISSVNMSYFLLLLLSLIPVTLFFFNFILWPHPKHMEVSGPGI